MAEYTGGNTTGFVSPAGDSLESRIDLGAILNLSRPSRYPVRVSGDALASRGIHAGDILIADAASPPAHGKVAIVMLRGSVLVGQLAYRQAQWWLQSGMSGTAAIAVAGEDAEVWAVVTGLIRTDV